jgi:sulfur-oxidizing protein SoxZ
MAIPKPRVKVAKTAKKGEVIQIKTLIAHKMESGQRKDKKTGEKIPRMIINSFMCTYNGQEVFACDWHPAISANPYMAFYVRAAESGTLDFKWTDDDGQVYEKSAEVNVT